MSRLNALQPKPTPAKCCECGQSKGLLIRWVEPATQFVCPGCARKLDYPEFCYDSCKGATNGTNHLS